MNETVELIGRKLSTKSIKCVLDLNTSSSKRYYKVQLYGEEGEIGWITPNELASDVQIQLYPHMNENVIDVLLNLNKYKVYTPDHDEWIKYLCLYLRHYIARLDALIELYQEDYVFGSKFLYYVRTKFYVERKNLEDTEYKSISYTRLSVLYTMLTFWELYIDVESQNNDKNIKHLTTLFFSL